MPSPARHISSENILQGTFEGRAQQIVMKRSNDPDWVRDLLLSISRKLRERTTYKATLSDLRPLRVSSPAAARLFPHQTLGEIRNVQIHDH